MAEQADVYISNTVKKKRIQVIRNVIEGREESAVAITDGDQEQFYLAGTDVSLTIRAPEGMDTKECVFSVQSDIDLSVLCSRSDSSWTIKMVPNELPPDTPTTVNVNVGEIEPI
jgi:hypothetical protein